MRFAARQHGKEKAGQKRNDRDHHEQFDEREGSAWRAKQRVAGTIINHGDLLLVITGN